MGRTVTCGYHCTVKPLSFGRGQSAVHTAAYNARAQLRHEREDKLTKDYGKTHEAPLFTGIFAREDAPDWVRDREQLWNRAEAAERQKVNGRPARNLIVAFPHELDQQQREWLLKDFVREEFVRRGMIADVAMHEPDKHGDQRNFHAHILLTMRKLDGDDFAKTKHREWNSKEQLEAWREGWAERGAKALHRAGHPIEAERWRHGHRTLTEQRTAARARGDGEYSDSLAREATMHKGPKLSGMERREGRDAAGDRLDELRGILDRNEIRLDMKDLERELKALEKEQREQQKREAEAAALRRQVEEQARAAEAVRAQQAERLREATARAAELRKEEQAKADQATRAAEEAATRAVEAAAARQRAAAAKKPETREQPATPPVERPHVAIQIDHAAAEAEARRRAERKANVKARADANFIEGWDKSQGGDWLDTVNPYRNEPTRGPTPEPTVPPSKVAQVGNRAIRAGKDAAGAGVDLAGKGLRVADRATGKVMQLTDFVIDFLSGGTAPQPGNAVDMGFTTDPERRHQQQLARHAQRKQAESENEALESIAEDIKSGRNLKPEDIRHLTHQHLEQIMKFGDSAMQEMIEEARRHADRHWKGNERERD